MKAKIVVTASAVLLLALGLLLNFMPQESASALGIPASPATTAMLQVLAAALLGMGILDWFSRANRMGGIYGRPLALGNFLLFGAGAIALSPGHGLAASRAIQALAIAYSILALGYCWLIFFGDPVAEEAKGKPWR